MAGPQNGVNGNIHQAKYGYMPAVYSLGGQSPRTNNQNLYAFNDIQQVSNAYVNQVFPSPLNNNAVRSVSPMINQQQNAFYYQYPPPYAQHPFGYGQTFIPASQYSYAQDSIPTQTVNYVPTNRKSTPLTIVDPTNNTDVDLCHYQSQTDTEKKSKALHISNIEPSSKESKEEIDESVRHKADNNLENIVEESNESVSDECNNSIVIPEDCIETEKKAIIIDNDTESIESTQNIEIVKEDTIKTCQGTDELENEIVEQLAKENNIEDTHKNESPIESEDTEDDHNPQDEALTSSSENNPSNYFLPINKKESDATTLRRKLIYDREYLITIKGNILCQKKPSNLLPDCDFSEIIYNESQNISCKKPENHYPNSNNNFKKQNTKSNNNYQNKYQKQPPQKYITLNHDAIPVFERLKSSYLPPQLRSKEKDIDPFNELKRNIKCNLNKITPQNFQECLLEIGKLNIKEKDEMTCLIDEIFIKAVQEEAYSVTYAQFCNKISHNTENQTFKGQLLKKCQDMFQTPIQDQLDIVRKDWMLKIDNESDAKMKSLYESDLEEQVKKAKDKYFGNIRFIGELFLHQLLAGKVILSCISELIKGKNDSDALLALCKLMETCGKQIDERHKDHMNNFLRSMDELSKSKELETRIRFKLKDIIDMRKRNWSLRHIQQEKKINPKTLEEQKEEALAEAALAASKLAAIQTTNKRNNRNVQPNSVRRQISAPQKSIHLKSLSVPSHTVDYKTVLGPSRSNWAVGSGSKPRSRDGDEWTSMQNPIRVANKSRSREQSPQVKLLNRYITLESSAEASGADSRPSSPPIRYPAIITKAYRIRKNTISTMTDDERADIIFNDLLLAGEFDIDSWTQISNAQSIIEKWIDDMFEKDSNCRRSIGDSFSKLIQRNIISYELLTKSLQSFVSNIDELICDIPKLWDFFAEFLERFICDKNSNISFILNVFQEILPNENVARCISLTLHAASSRLGHNIVGHVFHKSHIKWENIVPNQWQHFVDKNELNFTIVGGAPLSRFGGQSLLAMSDQLQTMLSDNATNEVIFDYFERHIDKPTWKSCECSRTISSCILKAMTYKSKTTIRSYLIDKFEIIKMVSQNKVENEIEVLKSVLNMAHELDDETLTIIYDVIMTHKTVSEKAFSLYLEDHSLKSQPNFDRTFPIVSQLYR